MKLMKCFVDEIFAAAIAKHAPRQRHFVIGHIDARCDQPFALDAADGQGNFRHAERFAGIRAVENHVRHFAAAQRLGRLLAQNPANRVRNIRFAAAIGPDNAGDARLEIQRSFVRKRLEPQHGQILQIHGRNEAKVGKSSKAEKHYMQG